MRVKLPWSIELISKADISEIRTCIVSIGMVHGYRAADSNFGICRIYPFSALSIADISFVSQTRR